MPNAPQAKKLFWMHVMILLGEEAHVESWFCVFRDSSNIDARQVHGLHGTYHMLRNQFGQTRWNCRCTRWNYQIKCIIWNLASVQLDIVLVLVQDSCMVCVQCTIVSETRWNYQIKCIIWNLASVQVDIVLVLVQDSCMVLQGEEAQVKAQFGLFGDSANLDERLVYSLHGTYHILINQFGRTRQNSQIMCVIWNLASICLETLLVQVQDWCMVCA